ncbi:MAG: hypothetical protein D6675_09805 [Gemmatimonadetes bacterium]|nr:MAG: hypothetical protein D6675_09805 [Gemmatimonadota bacterium]
MQFITFVIGIWLFFVWLQQLIDVTKRSKKELPPKVFWILGMVIPWFGQVWIPAIVALIYKYTVRERLEGRESPTLEPPFQQVKFHLDVDDTPPEVPPKPPTGAIPPVPPIPPISPRRHPRRTSKPLFRPDPNRFALILEDVTPGYEDEVLEGIQIVRECDETQAKLLLRTPSLLATDLTEETAHGIGKELELIGAKIRVLSMQALAESGTHFQHELLSKERERRRHHSRSTYHARGGC